MISLKSENQLLKKYTKELNCQKVNLSKSIECNLDNIRPVSSDEISPKMGQFFEYLNSNLNNYFYSYGSYLKASYSLNYYKYKKNYIIFPICHKKRFPIGG